MRWGDTLDLITVSYTTNTIGDSVATESTTTVFANKKSVRSNEFYQAQAIGLKPEIMFEVKSLDYSGQESLRYDLKKYNIIRTYDKNGEITELVCVGLVV